MSEKKYQALIKDRIFIGGVDQVDEVMQNEKIDVIYDLRAEAPTAESKYHRIHQPIVDDAEHQEESVKKAIDAVITSYNEGKNIYFHCGGGSNRAGTVATGTLLALGHAEELDQAEEMARAIRSKIKVKPEMKAALKNIFPRA